MPAARPPLTDSSRRAPSHAPTPVDAYLGAIAARGVDTFLANGRGLDMVLRRIGDRPVPLLVSDGRAANAAVASPTAHHLGYPLHEMGRARGRVARSSLALASRSAESALRTSGFDRVVFVNHWLFPSAVPLPSDRDALAGLLHTVARDWPRHAVIVPGIVPTLTPDLLHSLIGLGGHAVPSRVVHLQRSGRSLAGGAMRGVRHNRHSDYAVFARHAPRATSDPAFLAAHAGRLAELYRHLYLERHPARLNPQFTPDFFRLLAESGAFEGRAWTDDAGRPIAFNIRLVDAAGRASRSSSSTSPGARSTGPRFPPRRRPPHPGPTPTGWRRRRRTTRRSGAHSPTGVPTSPSSSADRRSRGRHSTRSAFRS